MVEEPDVDAPFCRICWLPADARAGGGLVSPCACAGSIAHVHPRCHAVWCSGPPLRTRCEVCGAAYQQSAAAMCRRAGRRALAVAEASATAVAVVAAGLTLGLPALALGATAYGVCRGVSAAARRVRYAADPKWRRREQQRRRARRELQTLQGWLAEDEVAAAAVARLQIAWAQALPA